MSRCHMDIDQMNMDNSNRTQLFDDWAKHYDQSIQTGGSFPLTGYEQVLNEEFSAADALPGLKVLDLGIGTGNLASLFIDAECSIWGLDFAANMLVKAKEKLPQAVLVQADLLGDWPPSLDQRFDRIVSAYVLHEFPLSEKMHLIRRLIDRHLAVDGRIVIGDVAFPSIRVREQAREKWASQWDEEEYYWAADETAKAGNSVGLHIAYEQISRCGGVFVFKSSRSR